MSDTSNAFGFGKYVPGFDFLQNLATSAVKGASGSIPQLPNLSHWVAPTINVEDLERRIEELKAVQFWLDQNATALKATIQALEVQKMTLATLQGMNFNMADVANALKLKAADTVVSGVQSVTEKAASTAGMISGVASAAASTVGEAAKVATHAHAPAAAPVQPAHEAAAKKKAAGRSAKAGAGAHGGSSEGVIDPLQWWGALTNQFQQIAANAMKDVAKQTALDTTRNVASGLAKEAIRTATDVASSMTRGAARKATAPARAVKKAAGGAVRKTAKRAPGKR